VRQHIEHEEEQLECVNFEERMSVDFNLVQLFTANIFSVKEQKRYNGKYTHYTEIFPLETQTGKTNIFYIHSHHTLFTIQYTYRSQRHPKP
jgi:hypothetical protein